MESKSTKGTVLTIVGVSMLALSIAGQLTSYISRGAFAGLTLLGCIIFFAGVTLLRDQLAHK
jgi:hypothetical protein